MLKRLSLMAVLCLGQILAQDRPLSSPDTDPAAQPPASEQQTDQNPAPGQSQANRASPAASEPPEREVSINPKIFARNFFSDQKMIWTYPARVATGHHVWPTLAIVGITGALVAGVDPYEGRFFRRHASDYTSFNNALSEHRTTAATLLIPTAFFGTGLIKKDKYLANTGLLALEAWVDVDVLGEGMRTIFRRERPYDIPVDGNFRNTWFKTLHNPLNASGSFPSGHTAWGFAVATVIARRYSKHKWVPIIAYSLAALDGISRITSSNHFAADDFFGAALGYTVGRYVVLRQ